MRFRHPPISMKKLLPIFVLLAVVASSGCVWRNHKPATAAKPKPVAAKTIVAPDDSLAAKVIRVNTVGRFVVLNFAEGQMPKLAQHLFLYRAGLRVAEVKVVGPQQETSIVADIVSGDAQSGDTVRDQ
jgi:hypothetical protein